MQVVDSDKIQVGEDITNEEVNTEGWDIDSMRKDGRGAKYRPDSDSFNPF